MKLLAVLVLVLVVVTLLEVEGNHGRTWWGRRASTYPTASTCPTEGDRISWVKRYGNDGKCKKRARASGPCSGNDERRKQDCSCDPTPLITCEHETSSDSMACQHLSSTGTVFKLDKNGNPFLTDNFLEVRKDDPSAEHPFTYHFINMTFDGNGKTRYCVEFEHDLDNNTRLDMVILPPCIAHMDETERAKLIDCYSDMTPTDTSPCLPCEQRTAFQTTARANADEFSSELVKIQPGKDFIIGFILHPDFTLNPDGTFASAGGGSIDAIVIKECKCTCSG